MPEVRHVPDLLRQFRSLNAEGERIAVTAGFDGRAFDDYRYSIYHDGEGRNNHFQGVGRTGKYLLVTGSYPFQQKRSDLFVLELGSRSADPGPWGSNLARNRDPQVPDCLVAYYAIDQAYWHAGSFALVDDTLVVPLEGDGGDSIITFVDVSDPPHPQRKNAEDIRRPAAKAGVVAATWLPSGHALLASWSDSDNPVNGAAPPFHLDLYVSGVPGALRGFRLLGRHEPLPGDAFHRQFQGLDFVWQRAAAGDELFLIGFENTSPRQPNPSDPGQNRAYLYRVTLPPAWMRPDFDPATVPAGGQLPTVAQLLDDHAFTAAGDWYNMDAGACAYVDSNQQLLVYSVYHHRAPFRGKDTDTLAVKCSEFRSVEFQSTIDRIDDAWVELYEGPGPTGRRLAVLGPWEWSVENTKQCYVNDRSFAAVSAVQFQIPAERAYVLYPERGFQGEGALVLRGTGAVEGADLGPRAYAFGSCRFLPLSVAEALPGARVV
jgi:hypothetical protein